MVADVSSPTNLTDASTSTEELISPKDVSMSTKVPSTIAPEALSPETKEGCASSTEELSSPKDQRPTVGGDACVSSREVAPTADPVREKNWSTANSSGKHKFSTTEQATADPPRNELQAIITTVQKGFQEMKEEMKKGFQEMKEVFQEGFSELKSAIISTDRYGGIYQRICTSDLVERLRQYKWVADHSYVQCKTISLNDAQRNELDKILKQTKYHSLLALLPEESQLKLQSTTQSIETDAVCTITLNPDEVADKTLLENAGAQVLSQSPLLGPYAPTTRHVFLCGEATSQKVYDGYWNFPRSWERTLALIAKNLTTDKALQNFVFKMLQMERLITAWRILLRPDQKTLFPLSNMWLTFMCNRRPFLMHIQSIARAVPTVHEMASMYRLMFLDNMLTEEDQVLERPYSIDNFADDAN